MVCELVKCAKKIKFPLFFTSYAFMHMYEDQDESNKIEMEENAAYGPTGAHPTADQDPDYEEIPDAKDIFDTTGNMAYGIVV